jgi:L-ascorbate 6-phosphate lactonase
MYEPVLHGAALLKSIHERPDVGTARVFPLGQSGVVIRFPETTVAVDLYLSNHIEAVIPRPFDHRRLTRAPLDPSEIDGLDVIICSHEHLDHLDVPTLRTLRDASPNAVVVLPLAARGVVLDLGWPEDRVIGTRGGETLTIGAVRVTAFGVPHETYDESDEFGHRYQGYAVSAASAISVTIVHVGDSRADDTLSRTLGELRPDLLCLPINGRDENRQAMGFAGNMSAEEAVELAVASGARAVLPMHDDMFAQNIDDRARERFLSAAESVSGQRFAVVRPPVGGRATIIP